jgi:hypothetical protein
LGKEVGVASKQPGMLPGWACRNSLPKMLLVNISRTAITNRNGVKHTILHKPVKGSKIEAVNKNHYNLLKVSATSQ